LPSIETEDLYVIKNKKSSTKLYTRGGVPLREAFLHSGTTLQRKTPKIKPRLPCPSAEAHRSLKSGPAKTWRKSLYNRRRFPANLTRQ
jgi:hypothetical protein